MKRKNVWLVLELIIITVLSWLFIDMITTAYYARYFTGDITPFETAHLVVGRMERPDTTDSTSARVDDRSAMAAIRSRLMAMPEVQSVCFTDDYIYNGTESAFNNLYANADGIPTLGVRAHPYHLMPGEPFLATQGIELMTESPAPQTVESANADGTNGYAYITHALALDLYGSTDCVGKELLWVEPEYTHAGYDEYDSVKVRQTYRIAGVMQDFKSTPYGWQNRSVLVFDWLPTLMPSSVMIRLQPTARTTEFIEQVSPHLKTDFSAGSCRIAALGTYDDMLSSLLASDSTTLETQLFFLLLSIFVVNMLLGVVGTYWMRIRRMREAIGIRRSFGATRWRIMRSLLADGIKVYTVAYIIGTFIYMQFCIYSGIDVTHGIIDDTDRFAQFWPHFAVVSVVCYLVQLCVVALGVIIPAWRAIRMPIVTALHDE